MQDALDVLKVHENRAILLLDESCDTTMVEHCAHPESWDTEWGVLDVLHVASVNLKLLIFLIVEFLCSVVKLLDEFIRGCLRSNENETSLLVHFLV